MAENEKNVPIKEQDDGSVLARVEVPENFDDEENETKVEVKAEEDESDEEDSQSSDEDQQDDEETDDEDFQFKKSVD